MRKNTTLCYIHHDSQWLMLYRNKKRLDPNAGKWIGVGGKLEEGETPQECVVREVMEETGIQLNSFVFHGVIEFINDQWDDEDMYLFSSDDFTQTDSEGMLQRCNEGTLRWIPQEEMFSLPMWEGDKAFLQPLLEGQKEISFRLIYEGGNLKQVIDQSSDSVRIER